MKRILGLFLGLALVFGSCHIGENKTKETAALLPVVKIYKDSSVYRLFTLNADPYNQLVYIMFCDDRVKALDSLRYFLGSDSLQLTDLEVSGIVIDQEDVPLIMWMPKIPTTYEEMGTANHELLHLTSGVMRYAGVPFDTSTEEAYAYLMGYLSKQFYYKTYQ